MDSKYLILEAMSAIHHLFLKIDDFKLSDEVIDKLLRSYANLQHIRDDSSFIEIDIDLNDDFLKDQKRGRLSEMRSHPFNLNIDQAIKYEQSASGIKTDEDSNSVGLGGNSC